MNLAAVTLLCWSTLPGQKVALPNLDFREGTTVGWVGDGVYLSTANPDGANSTLGVCSSDSGNPSRKAMFRYVFDVPQGTGLIRFQAFAVLAKGCEANGRLDVLLLGKGNRPVPKLIRTTTGWAPTKGLLPRENGRASEYAWNLAAHGGERLQIAIVDQDERPGCYLFCSGFRVEHASDSEQREFARFMAALTSDHKLARPVRYESKHFTAWSNADDDFTVMRLRNCELLYDNFLTHFRRKGFAVREPATKLMVAIFDSQSGFEAYLGQKMPINLVGVYHPTTNRLVVYDIHQNRAVLDGKKKALDMSGKIPFDIDRVQYVQAVERHATDYCKDANLGTTIHEAAHQVSFNCGLLNRNGDVPMWLAEGLACYCEATDQGAWQGIGAPNPERIKPLTNQVRGKGHFLSLATLVGSDDWRKEAGTMMLGYAQSWALFRLLMEERPQALRSYLTLIYSRRVPEYRLTDFRQIFGADLSRLARRYQDYLHELVDRYGHTAK
ncbi:MAG TPA: DUF1570 domain-containing protein [Gemmataceae bacterium]|nr:DUF1570 domain-containing protein [Gemmataceae bacterium]